VVIPDLPGIMSYSADEFNCHAKQLKHHPPASNSPQDDPAASRHSLTRLRKHVPREQNCAAKQESQSPPLPPFFSTWVAAQCFPARCGMHPRTSRSHTTELGAGDSERAPFDGASSDHHPHNSEP
jgi:hypothetical protein